jgi:hypothetical protein
VAVVQYTFTHKQYIEYREGTYITIKNLNIHNNTKINQFGKCGPCPVFANYTLEFTLQLRKKHGNPSVRAAARTPQTDTVLCKNNEQYNPQKKNSNTYFQLICEKSAWDLKL